MILPDFNRVRRELPLLSPLSTRELKCYRRGRPDCWRKGNKRLWPSNGAGQGQYQGQCQENRVRVVPSKMLQEVGEKVTDCDLHMVKVKVMVKVRVMRELSLL